MIDILFVDDEANVLEALKKSLRPMRERWSPVFAPSGSAALQLLEKTRFDAIVADMRMPEMDGLTLLDMAAEHDPGIVRILLAAASDMKTIMEAAGTAHQCLVKPCPVDLLASRIDRALSLRNLVGSKALVKIVSKLDTIPSAPPLYLEFIRLLDSPMTSIEDIGRLVSRDMGMCAKVLQLANSPLFGGRCNVSDPRDAVSVLGFNLLKNLALAVHVFRKLEHGLPAGFSVDSLWNHSFKTSLYAGAIARALLPADRRLAEQAQVAGLLHDVGQVLIASNLPADFESIATLARRQKMNLFEAEQQVLGVSHAEVGAYILALWGLPPEVIEAIVQHHNLGGREERPSKVSLAVHIGDVLAFECQGEARALDRPAIDWEGLEGWVSGEQVDAWRELCRDLAG